MNKIGEIHKSFKSVIQTGYDIVTKGHGGELKVETKEGVGTTFIIILPYKTNT